MTLRRAARKDANKDAIVAVFEAEGCKVYDLRQPVDLLVWRLGGEMMAFVEVKDGSKPPSRRKFTDAQQRFLADCPAGFLFMVKTEEEARKVARML